MKQNSLKKFGFSLVQIMLVVALLALLASFALPPAQAQQYFTNSTTATGGYQPGDSLTPPLVPSATIARQVAAGILAGAFTATNTANVISFGTNIYTVAPVVTAGTSSTTNAATVTAVTTTNVTVTTTYNANSIYWHAIGH